VIILFNYLIFTIIYIHKYNTNTFIKMSDDKSIFTLKQSEDDLDMSNHKILNTNLRQITASRGIAADNFSSGIQNFKFEMSGNRWWRPSNSYMRLRCKLTKNGNAANPTQPSQAGTPLTLSDGIAPAMGLCGNLYQNMDFKMGDTTVSRISNSVAQVDTLKHRLSKSRSWAKSIGASTNFWDESFKQRQNAVCADGVDSDRITQELKRVDIAGYAAADTVQYVAGTNTAIIVYAGAQANGLWKAGDLYTDYTSGSVEAHQVITAVATTDNITWIIHLSQFPAIGNFGPTNANQWSRTRFTGTRSQRVSEFELVWTPPLSIFDYEGCLPCGRYELSMLPFSKEQMKKNAIESIGLASKLDTDYHFEVDDIYLCIEELEGENCTDMKYLLDLTQTRAQSFPFTAGTGFSQKSFDISPATRAITIAYQDSRTFSDTRITASKFKIQEDIVPQDAALRINSDFALKLSRQYFSYGASNYPPQDSDPKFDATTDRTTQRYVESLMQSRAYHDTGGSESLSEFHDAGSYYHQKIYRPKGDGSTRCVVHSSFASAVDSKFAEVLLFDEYSIVAQVTLANGAIKEIVVEEI
jgi:hypothetical protein